ncbi:hypothetical protein F4778DRAFT_769170 [Xylariomycetidae sp. FL2044]|nr:hypothetical protein F4778DRAFT_769170 [Xylariomycetidae sp. FL2044]
MSNTASTEPFKMRIPSPDPELSGELLSREVPEDPNRIGSIYADQFLAHKCPPHFDELQRRQFFCILDLRRLKYAANEIFAKKDWKLNINNFAKEYEKSRGLIMLRYGLYEFKNVKPSEEVLKKWRAAHGLPDPEPEDKTTTTISEGPKSRSFGASVTGSTKRKAEEELAPKDNTLMASTANQNKRRNLERESPDPAIKGPAPFKKSKRKADETEDLEENQPSKLHKPAVSTATSKFASILDKAQSGSLNGLKPTPSPANGASGSVLSSHKIGSVPATSSGNIFSYLSESSANSSGNEIGNAGDDDDESDSGSDHEAEIHGARPSSVPSAVAISALSAPSANAPTSGFSAPNAAPSTDMNFTFGQQAPSTPKPTPANPGAPMFGGSTQGTSGGPSFNFTQATPPQNNTPSIFAQKPATGGSGIFGSLLPAADGSKGASKYIPIETRLGEANRNKGSPLPAPSSLGTTPVNGTPEPQTQHEDGEEGSHEQISLTNGGPGEEDEEILHEVRAKVMKYIPVVKGSDEEQENKSPWSTQGVGPLRVLKNKTTGSVRLLLRAEPRGHIALNKTILPRENYKATEKTVKLTTTGANSGELESWVLQVKKPESAQELARVLEAHKSANQ